MAQVPSFSLADWRRAGILVPGECTRARAPLPAPLHHLGETAFIRINLERTPTEGQVVVEIGALKQYLWLTSTVPALGGLRFWFNCPSCARRRLALFAQPYTNTFRIRCRLCHSLAYPSQRMNQENRWSSRARKLFERAGCSPRDDCHYKPKRMRWSTFNRLIDDAKAFDNAALELGWNKIANIPSIRRHLSAN